MTFPQGDRWTKLYLCGIAFLVCLGFANTSHSQSDDTCIAYMEALAESRQAKRIIREKHRPIISKIRSEGHKRCEALESKMYEDRRNCKSDSVEEWLACNRRMSDASARRNEICARDDAKLFAAKQARDQEIENVSRATKAKIRSIYDGPVSDNEEVLGILILQDLERCDNNGFPIF